VWIEVCAPGALGGSVMHARQRRGAGRGVEPPSLGRCAGCRRKGLLDFTDGQPSLAKALAEERFSRQVAFGERYFHVGIAPQKQDKDALPGRQLWRARFAASASDQALVCPHGLAGTGFSSRRSSAFSSGIGSAKRRV